MNTRAASPSIPADISAGDIVVELATASASAPAGGWVKLTPRGRITTRNGVAYNFDPETLAARFDQDGVKLPFDFDHGIARLASQGHTVAAIGWIEEMQARADGLYGRVDWLDAGKAALAAKSHRYVSPTFHHTDDGTATWLHGAALVTAPALTNMPALADASGAKPEQSMTKNIAAALGLAETADEAACLAAIGALKPAAGQAPAGMVSAAVHSTTLATLDATKRELDGLKATQRQEKVDSLLEGALKSRRILPAQRQHYATLCATDDGLEQVTALLAATPEGLKSSGLDGKLPAAGEDETIDPEALAAEARALVTAAAAAGNHLTIQAAVAQVRAKKKGAAA